MIVTKNRKVLVALRIVQAVLLLLIFALILSGAGSCQWSSTWGVSCNTIRSDPGYWKEQFPKMGGQVFVVLMAVIMMIASIALAVVALKAVHRSLSREMVWAIGSGLMCVLCGSLEIWYAVGANGAATDFLYVQGWASAVFFLYLTAVIYFVDAFISKRYPGI